ncbi:DUF202 domain-containing protein [Pantoea sp. 18069]|uniref:DUF202 domain-containing protein n=1 Tax=Pantoea sp. 18069 TaxID=2681415 RepID=UPI00190F6241|nr:DUF202 domain-containing protein [Pantoea sp. 18069]
MLVHLMYRGWLHDRGYHGGHGLYGKYMRDPGLQPERTALAWNRTALSMLVVAAAWLKIGTESHRLEIVITGAFLLSGAVFAWVIGMMRRNALLRVTAVMTPSGHLLAALALGAGACAGVAMASLGK